MKVSVYFITYNHYKYIRQALDSILNQKVDFDYEIIIHDDASTDGTSDIVREYAQRYPDKIVAIIQPHNIYNTDIDSFNEFIKPRIRGEYLTFLEGDDYWTDEYKLQKQVDFLENHKDYVAIAHNTERIDCVTGKKDKLNVYNDERDLTVEDMVENGEHSIHLNSLMYRMSLYNENYPKYMRKKRSFGDVPTRIWLVTNGKVQYLPKCMSAYRYRSEGSWTVRNENPEKRQKVYKQIIDLYDDVNKETDYKYNDIFDRYIKLQEFKIIELNEEYDKMFLPQYKEFYQKKPVGQKIKIQIKRKYPAVYKMYKKIKHE